MIRDVYVLRRTGEVLVHKAFSKRGVDEAIFMATRLIVMSPRPGRIIKSYNLDFNQRFFKNRDARRVKSLPEFIDTRQEVLDIIHSDEIRIDQG